MMLMVITDVILPREFRGIDLNQKKKKKKKNQSYEDQDRESYSPILQF